MAFKMTFPTIKGSPIHKKATSAVSQSRTSADPSLIYAASEMGKSTVPGAIDYEIKGLKELKFKDTKSKPPKDEAGPGTGTYKEYLDENKGDPGDEGILSKKEWRKLNRQYTDIDPKEKKSKPTEEEKEEITTKDVLGDQYEDPFAPRYTDHRTEEERETFKKKRGEDEEFKRAEEAYNKQKQEEDWNSDEREEESALELRKQSVFKNAIKGGKIQKELIKQGFDPYK